MKTISEYQVVDHGFDGEQYFPGCGTSYTEFEDVATGVGETAREAFEDAIESIAQNEWDVSSISTRGHGFSRQTVQGYLRSIGISKEDREETETHAYVSIRVK